jgi:hypothetical protein
MPELGASDGVGQVTETQEQIQTPQLEVSTPPVAAVEHDATTFSQPQKEDPLRVSEETRGVEEVKTPDGHELTVLDAAEVERSLRENGSYTLPKGTKVLLSIYGIWPNGDPRRVVAFSEVAEEGGIEVGKSAILSSFGSKEYVEDETGLSFDKGDRMLVGLQPETAERREENGKNIDSLLAAYDEIEEIEEHGDKYGLTRRAKAERRKLRMEIDKLRLPVKAIDSILSKEIMGKRPDVLKEVGVKLEHVRRLDIIVATTADFDVPTGLSQGASVASE